MGRSFLTEVGEFITKNSSLLLVSDIELLEARAKCGYIGSATPLAELDHQDHNQKNQNEGEQDQFHE